MLDIKKINLYGLSIPFKKNVETNWSKRSGTTSFLIEVKTKKNLSGYGEMIAFFSVEQCEITLKKMIRDIEGFKLNEISKMMNRALYGGGWMRTGKANDLGLSAWAAIEMALFDAYSKTLNISIADFFGGSIKNDFSLAVNIDVENIKSMCKEAKRLVKKGYQTLFIKVGKNNLSLEKDILMLSEIQKSVGNKIQLYIDANGSWSLHTAIKAFRKLEKLNLNIVCIEQPVMNKEGLNILRKKFKFPIGVNELLSNPQNILNCLKDDVADFYILDIYEAGGLINFFSLCKTIITSGKHVICRAHGGSNLSYIMSLKILSAVNSNIATVPHQCYELQDKNLINWSPKMKNGILNIDKEQFKYTNLNKKLFLNYSKLFKKKKIYEIYNNKNKKSVPYFPKY
jgi:L-alanine-DL-glutamate epimerase-like enolase superfamily enzyme